MCLAQGPQRSDAGKHSTTEPLRSLQGCINWLTNMFNFFKKNRKVYHQYVVIDQSLVDR